MSNQFMVIFYVFFWIVRINGCVRRGRQPLLRGPEWFFTVPVEAGFYTGAGAGGCGRGGVAVATPVG